MFLTKTGAQLATGVIYGIVLSIIGFGVFDWQFWFALITFAISESFIRNNTGSV